MLEVIAGNGMAWRLKESRREREKRELATIYTNKEREGKEIRYNSGKDPDQRDEEALSQPSLPNVLQRVLTLLTSMRHNFCASDLRKGVPSL